MLQMANAITYVACRGAFFLLLILFDLCTHTPGLYLPLVGRAGCTVGRGYLVPGTSYHTQTTSQNSDWFSPLFVPSNKNADTGMYNSSAAAVVSSCSDSRQQSSGSRPYWAG